MKFAIFSRTESAELDRLCHAITAQDSTSVLNPCQCAGFDMAISFGGDGTFLSTVRRTLGLDLPILGINNGRLGFLADTPLENAVAAITAVIEGRYALQSRTLLNASGLGEALNEFTIQKRTTAMVHVTVSVDGESVAAYWADGVIVSTPTGSTAYALSTSGAILAPDSHCFIVSPIAPHNLGIRPLVVSDESLISITVRTRNIPSATATVDNKEKEAFSGETFDIKRSTHSVKVVKLEHISFYKTLREKLQWGVDPRN